MTKNEKKQKLRELYLKDISTLNHTKPSYSEYEQFVPGEGSPDAPILFIGEAPGETESKLARPFVGKSGQLLRSLLKELAFDPADYFITNIVKWRPPKNRTPTSQEIMFCFNTYLEEEIAIIKPRIICTLGASALRSIYPLAPSVTTARGKMIDYNGTHLLPTIHPAYAIYDPEQKKFLRQDLLSLKKYC